MPATSGAEQIAPRGVSLPVPADGLRLLGQRIADWGPQRDDLPWRHTRDPWAVLVSEVMAQQTQIGRVVPAYHAFLERFPTPGDCARAPLSEVLQAWAGLGYHRRARHLHLAAQVVTDRHDGMLPDDLGQLLALPGVGPYTARAVLAFAFESDVGLVDTNAGRLLARAATGRPLRPAEAQRAVDAMVPPATGWRFNQALLDLGALVCVARTPACDRCPLAGVCVWNASGRPEPDPAGGSAGVSTRQSRLEGSDRQGRGRLLAALRERPVTPAELPVVTSWDDDARIGRMVASLVADGLAVAHPDGVLTLPE